MFLVSIDITSKDKTIGEMAKYLNIIPGGDSHNIGDPRGRNRTWDVSIIRINPRCLGDRPLDEHLAEVIKEYEKSGAAEKVRTCPFKVDVYMNIGVTSSTFTATVAIANSHLKYIAAENMDMEICVYPARSDD